ncbi:MAG: peptidoglycan editing factor PgeF [Elusimicrobia bacterium]|nr:peptidoglycan editing factor PgeF [Candidatus Obscuribacterium magneticum]
MALPLDFSLRSFSTPTPQSPVTISTLSCGPLEEAGFLNAFSTRLGGVSPLPEGALNLSCQEDTVANVTENRRRFLSAIGASAWPLVIPRQTHSVKRFFVDSILVKHIRQVPGFKPEADALINNIPHVLVGVESADCLPVLIADQATGVVAVLHAGWRGTKGRITEKTMADLKSVYGVKPEDCLAALGPCACVDCYEVGEELVGLYQREFSYWQDLFKGSGSAGPAVSVHPTLDLRAANRHQLLESGLRPEHLFVSEACTMHQNDLFFSYRREGGGGSYSVGRLLAVIGWTGEPTQGLSE